MEKKIFQLSDVDDFSNIRIDKFLQLKLADFSRTKIQKLIHEGFVKINDKIVSETSKKIKNNDKIEIFFPPPKETNIKSTKMNLNILYDDKDIIV